MAFISMRVQDCSNLNAAGVLLRTRMFVNVVDLIGGGDSEFGQ